MGSSQNNEENVKSRFDSAIGDLKKFFGRMEEGVKTLAVALAKRNEVKENQGRDAARMTTLSTILKPRGEADTTNREIPVVLDQLAKGIYEKTNALKNTLSQGQDQKSPFNDEAKKGSEPLSGPQRSQLRRR